MGLFSFLKSGDTQSNWAHYQNTPDAILLDVRTPQEYAEGHVPGSRNLPLQEISNITAVFPNPDTPLFVYCLSGGRSRQAVSALRRMGYAAVQDLGGIHNYSGKVER